MIQVKSFASTKLINLAQQFRNELLSRISGIEAPGSTNGMIQYEDNISICVAEKIPSNIKVINPKFGDPKITEKDEIQLVKDLEHLTEDIMPELDRTCSVYIDEGLLVRCINIKSR